MSLLSKSNLLFILLVNAVAIFYTSSAFQPLTVPSAARSSRNDSSSSSSSSRNTQQLSMIGSIFGAAPSQPLLTPDLADVLVQGTSLQDKELECVYKASTDGWSAIDFHQKVDEQGSALVVAMTRSGKVFGGFNPLGWRSTDDYYNSNAAFLWFADGGKNGVIKCPVLTGGNAAIFDYATGGPQFGAADLIIGEPKAAIMGGFAGPDMMDTSANAGSLKEGKCSPGGTYQFPDGRKKLPVIGNFQLVQLEIYTNANVGSIGGSSGGSWWPF